MLYMVRYDYRMIVNAHSSIYLIVSTPQKSEPHTSFKYSQLDAVQFKNHKSVSNVHNDNRRSYSLRSIYIVCRIDPSECIKRSISAAPLCGRVSAIDLHGSPQVVWSRDILLL